jgi:hypothetical protein
MSIKSLDQIRKERAIYIESLFSDDSLKKHQKEFCLNLYSHTQRLDSFLKTMDPIIDQMQRLNISADDHIDTLTCRYGEFSAGTIMQLPQFLREISPAFSDRQDTLKEYKSIRSFNAKYQYVKNIFKRTCDVLAQYISHEELRLHVQSNSGRNIFKRNLIIAKLKKLLFRNT